MKNNDIRVDERGKLELVSIGGALVGRLTLEPGWRWTEHVKSIVQTEWCEAPHLQYQLSGILHIQMSDGTEFDTVKGQVSWLPAGHDA